MSFATQICRKFKFAEAAKTKNKPIKSTSAKKACAADERFVYVFITILTIFAAKLFGKLPYGKPSVLSGSACSKTRAALGVWDNHLC
ncbi:hypothetical protein [uncultured Campylobacter sp.]|uniref:hypothetical protein n=1 Tax=uncultured Campylobacter sp. TaxID=218934 RepID=UPI003211B4F9